MGGPAGPERRKPERVKLSVEDGPAVIAPQGEVYEEDGHLVAGFFLPFHGPRELKYHVGRRTITLWSRKEQLAFQTILVLPRWVNPDTFILSHKNGVYEFWLETPPQRPAAPA